MYEKKGTLGKKTHAVSSASAGWKPQELPQHLIRAIHPGWRGNRERSTSLEATRPPGPIVKRLDSARATSEWIMAVGILEG